MHGFLLEVYYRVVVVAPGGHIFDVSLHCICLCTAFKSSPFSVVLSDSPSLSYRECLIPEVSRTYHFDTGMHIDSYQQKKHFNTRSYAHDHFIPLHDLDR